MTRWTRRLREWTGHGEPRTANARWIDGCTQCDPSPPRFPLSWSPLPANPRGPEAVSHTAATVAAPEPIDVGGRFPEYGPEPRHRARPLVELWDKVPRDEDERSMSLRTALAVIGRRRGSRETLSLRRALERVTGRDLSGRARVSFAELVRCVRAQSQAPIADRRRCFKTLRRGRVLNRLRVWRSMIRARHQVETAARAERPW